MTDEMKQKYLQKMSYEEWEAKIFEETKNRFYLTKIDLSSMNYITFYFKEDFKVAISKYHFDLWYNRYLYTDNYYVSIEQTIKELDDLITQYWLQKIKINS